MQIALLAHVPVSKPHNGHLVRVPVPPPSIAELALHKQKILSRRRKRQVRLSCGDGKEFDVAIDRSTVNEAICMVEDNEMPCTVYWYRVCLNISLNGCMS